MLLYTKVLLILIRNYVTDTHGLLEMINVWDFGYGTENDVSVLGSVVLLCSICVPAATS